MKKTAATIFVTILGMRKLGRRVGSMLVGVAAAGMLAGCALPGPFVHDAAPAWPPVESGPWQTYAREDVGFTIDVPPGFVPEQVGDDTVFHYKGFPILRVLLVDDTAARQRGLWVVGLPAGESKVGGHVAQFYSYNHEDFFTYTHTLAYVLPYAGKELGIEFRTEGESLDPTQQRILDSVRLSKG